MKKLMIGGIFVLTLMGLVLNLSAAEPIKLKFATMDPAQSPQVVNAYKPWLDRISQASKGTVKFEIFPGGSLGGNPTMQFKLVIDGVTDAAFFVPAYTQGRFPDDEVFELPFMANNALEAAIASQRMYKKGLLRGYDEVVVLGHYTTEMYYFHTSIPIKVPEDMKGHKFRAVNQFQSKLFERFNAAGVGMPTPAIAENMSRGLIEGAICDNSALFVFRIVDAAKYHLLVPFGNVSLVTIMNKKKFESLPSEAKEAINKHGADIVEIWMKATKQDIDSRWAKIKEERAKNITTPTGVELQAWKKACQPVIDEWTSKDPRRGMLIKAYQEELNRIRSGR
jgi:TRAP-type C4-dicarboxylate transport system substrate-binding protein